MDTDIMNMVYNSTKEYVKENHPALEDYFDDIWKSAVAKNSSIRKNVESEAKIGKASFASDDIVMLIVQVVIPFFSGIFSSLIAEAVRDRMKSSKKKVTFQLKTSDEGVVAFEMDINKKEYKELIKNKLVPIALAQIERRSKKTGKKKRSKQK